MTRNHENTSKRNRTRHSIEMKNIQLEHVKFEISRAKTTELQLKTFSYTSLYVYV